MKDQKIIVVTGAAGRIGSSICKKLEGRYTVIGCELPAVAKKLNQSNLLPLDLGSDESVKQTFSSIKSAYGTNIASVIHLAAYYSFSEEHSDNYDKITVKGTERLLSALQNFQVDQFLFTSTMLVHKPTKPGLPISETSPLEPSWDYPKSKAITEEKIRQQKGSISSVILRISGVYDDKCHSIPISHQIQRIYEHQFESHFFAGKTTHGAAFIHMDDLVDAIELAVEKRADLPKETIIILSEPKTFSYDQLQRQISRLLFNKEFTTFSMPKFLSKIGAWLLCHIPLRKKPFIQPWMIQFADDHYEMDTHLAEKLLGWKAKRSLDQTLPIIIADLKKDPKAWYKFNQLD